MTQEALRKLNEQAVLEGRSCQNAVTGFIHLNTREKNETMEVSIPLLENSYFALALLRSRLAENVKEGKSLLERILYFQNSKLPEQMGNFPIFLHEFPFCSDRYQGVYLLDPLHCIQKEFQHILGPDLREHLGQALNQLLAYCLNLYETKSLPFPISVRILTAAHQLGFAKALDLLEQLTSQMPPYFSPPDLGVLLSALYSVYPSLEKSSWKPLWEIAANSWHKNTCSYIGPGWEEKQVGLEPAASLYDLYMGYLSDGFSTRAFKKQPHLLQAVLVHPTVERFHESTQENQNGLQFLSKKFAYSLLEKNEKSAINERFYHPLKIIWGDPTFAHTFVCQGGNARAIKSAANGKTIEMTFELSENFITDDREKAREVLFFLDASDQNVITVSNALATTFTLQDNLRIQNGSFSLSLKYHLEQGEGQFSGHIMKGNRPSQISLQGQNRHQAFDWQIILRTLRRTNPCKIKVIITIEDVP